MVLINNKTFKELCEESDVRLNELGFSTTPGAFTKLFSDIINKHISDFYETLTINHMQSFVTTATGYYLDNIGIMLNCTRNANEEDDDYRKRICHQTLSLTKANETSIRLAVLNCDGVDDVVLKKYSHGPGSLTIVPVTKDVSINNISAVEEAIQDVVSCGEKVIVKAPTFNYVKFNISLSLSLSIDDIVKQSIRNEVRQAIINYINSLKVGEVLIINELTQRIMEVDERIINYSCDSFSINNKKCLFINQSCRWDEKFIISPDLNSVNIF